ncbi:3-deoxy-D-manno-octulosonic acid kinase [Marinobacter sp.]|uniref:3-deoxy-D-manno-octulosonic acid kinase n=1 Tax=Marinobacter sp. TaxID=50741 RepID=UPI002B27221E|nr:3-deoxy-D-manno-octulosonic acid kinase [Marinobacter sp.]
MQFPALKPPLTNEGRMLVAPEIDGVTADWFVPDTWGDRAVAVEVGGRGSAWFLRTDAGDLVLRHYRRGGLAGKIVERMYFYSGIYRARSFAEFQLTRELYQAALPVPRVVAAIVWPRALFWYQAAIIVERIPDAVNFPNSADVVNGRLWRQIGQMIRRFHEWGLDHVDLNCDNILVADDVTYLIDFDRCRRRGQSSPENWQERNLKRLKRSVYKRLSSREDLEIDRLWLHLISGYHDGIS